MVLTVDTENATPEIKIKILFFHQKTWENVVGPKLIRSNILKTEGLVNQNGPLNF